MTSLIHHLSHTNDNAFRITFSSNLLALNVDKNNRFRQVDESSYVKKDQINHQ